MQGLIRRYDGVISTRVGYSGGDVPNATYRNHGTHAEAIEIIFDPTKISYRTLLEFFFQIHDPTMRNRQGHDMGTSYRSAIFYTSDEQKRVAEDTIADVEASGLWPGKVVTEVSPAGPFWEAEPEHQDYLQRVPNGYTCHFIRPNWKLPSRKHAGRVELRRTDGKSGRHMSGSIAALFQRLTQGVYVVGVAHGEVRNAFTAAWLMQVSFDPLLLALSINPHHSSYGLLKEGGAFSVNVLKKGQLDLADRYGRPAGADKLALTEWTTGRNGIPLLRESLAWFECHAVGEHSAGDHVLVLGKVIDGKLLDSEAAPMTYRETGAMDGASALFPDVFGD